MKKLLLISVINLVAMTATAESFRRLNQDAAAVARAMLNPSVQKCVKEVESGERAKLSVSEVSLNQSRLPAVKLSGMLIRGGDMVSKEVTLTLTPSLSGQFGGVSYDCKVERGN